MRVLRSVVQFFHLEIASVGTKLTQLASNQLALLESHALRSGRAAAQAQALLLFHGQWDLELPVLLPDPVPKSLFLSSPKPEIHAEGVLKVFPNPSKDHTSVEYRIDRAFRRAQLEVVDLLGRVMYSRELQRDMDTVSLPLSNMEGVYLVTVIVDGQHYQITKLIVQ